MAPVHERMPVTVPVEHFATWLERRPLDPDERAELLAPAPDAVLTARRVPMTVSNVRNQGPQLLDQLADDPAE
jgi:putative SOS response-associated peptidase YedK